MWLDLLVWKMEYLFVISSKRDYRPYTSEDNELEIFENQVLYVLQEMEQRYLCYAPQNKAIGTVLKKYTEKQTPFNALGAVIVCDQLDSDPSLLTCHKNDKVIVLARCADGSVYCKTTGAVVVARGRVFMEKIFIEGELKSLPTFKEYSERSLNTSTMASPTISRAKLNKISEIEKSLDSLDKLGSASTIYKAIEKLNASHLKLSKN